MPDQFQNARAYYDVTFPSSGDGFSIANTKNALQGLGFLDFIFGQPRAHSPADTKILVRGRDASSFYNPVYAGDADQHLFISSGDSPAMAAPTSNPRIDIVYWTASGDIRVVTGTEAASPTLPALAPSGDTRIPICAIYHKTTMAKIVNFEDRNSNSGDSYIYQDLRPFLRTPGLTIASLSSAVPVSPTGDAQATSGTSTKAARGDHIHGGLSRIHVVGSGDLQGDVGFEGNVEQASQRFKFVNPKYQDTLVSTATDESFTSTSYINSSLIISFNQQRDGVAFFSFSGTDSGVGNIGCFYAITIDGEILHEQSTREGTGNSNFPISLFGLKYLKAGNHTIAMQFKVEATTGTLLASQTPARLRAHYPT